MQAVQKVCLRKFEHFVPAVKAAGKVEHLHANHAVQVFRYCYGLREHAGWWSIAFRGLFMGFGFHVFGQYL
jgi:hypothetical protein